MNPMEPNSSMGSLEKMMTWAYEVRLWFTQAARLGQLMARGAYLLGERRRLFIKLGEMAYEKKIGTPLAGGNTTPDELPAAIDRLVHQIDRLTKKLEIEEMLIRSVRFGVKPERPHRHPAEAKENEAGSKDEEGTSP